MTRHSTRRSQTIPQAIQSVTKSGFTLLELTISIGISSILIAGMTSSLLVAVQANDLGNGPFQKIESATQVLSQIDRELSYATEVTTPLDSPNAIEFILPDQTGDGLDEQIRYQWSDIENSSLERIFNGEPAQQLISDVTSFTVNIHSQQQNLIGDITESADQTWISQTNSFATSSFRIRKGYGAGTDFVPTLPTDAISWSVTSVDVRCRRLGGVNSNKTIYARVYTADSSRTPDELIDETAIQESTLSTSYQWFNVSFQNVQNRTLGERLCVTFEGENNSSQKSYLQVLEWSFYSPNTVLLTRDGDNASWASGAYRDLAIIIRGKYTTQLSVEVDYCQFAKFELLVGDEGSHPVRSVVQTHNIPQVTGQ